MHHTVHVQGKTTNIHSKILQSYHNYLYSLKSCQV